MNVIQVFEYGKLVVGEKYKSVTNDEVTFSHTHYERLAKFRGDKDFQYYSLVKSGGQDAIRFCQYVGVISVGDLQIEVLPKADKNDNSENNKWKNFLIEMLSAVFRLQAKTPSNANLKLNSNRILDVFINRFLCEVEEIMHRGLVKCYHNIEENSTALKGRLVFPKHISENIVHQERFFVEYTTYDRNHICNRLIYKALKLIPDITASNYISGRAKTIMFDFPEVDDINVDGSLFKKIAFDRKTEDYKLAISIAKLLLLNCSPTLKNGRGENVLALMFGMDKLWEEYVYLYLKRHLTGYTVIAQNTKKFWESDVGYKTIRPDIVVKEDNKTVCVLDTKWKCPDDDKPSDSDLKQMFVYSLYFKTKKVGLIYPSKGNNYDDEHKGRFFDYEDSTNIRLGDTICNMMFLPISCINKNNSDEKDWSAYIEGLWKTQN